MHSKIVKQSLYVLHYVNSIRSQYLRSHDQSGPGWPRNGSGLVVAMRLLILHSAVGAKDHHIALPLYKSKLCLVGTFTF
jgi:hypothetical protein